MTKLHLVLFAAVAAACASDDGGSPPPSNSAPYVALTAPVDGAFYDVDEVIVVSGAVADANEPDLSVLLLSWGGLAEGVGPASAAADGSIQFTIPDPSLGPHPLTLTVADGDGATASLSISLTVGVDADGDGYAAPEDCDDASVAIHPGAVEECNGIDDDCANGIDDGFEIFVWHPDDDHDGLGDPSSSMATCEDFSATHVLDGTDCDDSNALLNHDDDDLDGVDTCGGDCDDLDPSQFPGNPEICNGLDDNCAAGIDEGFPTTTWFTDGDLDGWGDPDSAVVTCLDFSGTHIVVGTDCDDQDATLNHDDVDLDGADTCVGDCDDLSTALNLDDVDGDGLDTCEGDCDDLDAAATFDTNWLADLDEDGYGAGASLAFGCNPVPDLVPELVGVDCDDNDATVNPGAEDVCEDGFDANCDEVDPSCGPFGSFLVEDGEPWMDDPPVYTCIEACALLFGGVDTDYHCSVDPVVLDYTAYVDGYADMAFCFVPVAEDVSKEDPNNPGYNCGAAGCSYSAYVLDHFCMTPNYCWLR
jgi:hypothetical protein